MHLGLAEAFEIGRIKIVAIAVLEDDLMLARHGTAMVLLPDQMMQRPAVTAAHPMITGAAPQIPPQNVFCEVRRFSQSV